jgi:D-glycero-D-manno-heptose 1,7-bisphosphate phosphatase
MTRFPPPNPAQGPPRRAVFLDRDDTLIENSTLPEDAFPATPGDLYRPEWVRPIPGAVDACRALADAGFLLVVITNQAGVARGNASLDQVRATNDRMLELFAAESGDPLIEAVYAAPHHPRARVEAYRGDHPWRKPNPGMILAACADLHLDPRTSWLVGDAERDLHAGVAAGLCPTRCLRVGPDAPCPGLPEAARRILDRERAGDPTAHAEVRSIDATTVTLRAPSGTPLADHAVRTTVESVAHAIAERTGVSLLAIETDDASITATLATHRLAATAFMAELRRATNTWHAGRGNTEPLWPRTPADDD